MLKLVDDVVVVVIKAANFNVQYTRKKMKKRYGFSLKLRTNFSTWKCRTATCF
jgi:hypothetical protein